MKQPLFGCPYLIFMLHAETRIIDIHFFLP